MSNKLKKGQMSAGMIRGAILSIVSVVILFIAYSQIIPEAVSGSDLLTPTGTCTTAGGYYNSTSTVCQVNSTNTTAIGTDQPIPLGSLFTSTGVIYVVIMVSLFIAVISGFLFTKK